MIDSFDITAEDPLAAVREWFAQLAACCAAVDYQAALALFAPDVVSFGTKAQVVTGLEALRREQWERIWPNISDFAIELNRVRGGGNDAYAWGVAPWRSTGYDRQGSPFDRPGRASIVLRREGSRWLAVHTHYSLAPGVPQPTYGRR